MARDTEVAKIKIDRKQIRVFENESIREFLSENDQYLRGRVLDYGCGKQPYRDLISGEYVPYDIPVTDEEGIVTTYQKPEGHFNTILLTQVLPVVKDPIRLLRDVYPLGDILIATYPTIWEEYGNDDYWRFTSNNMESIFKEIGYQKIKHQPRWHIACDDFRFVGGYGIIAKKI